MSGAAFAWHKLLFPLRCHLQLDVVVASHVGDSAPLRLVYYYLKPSRTFHVKILVHFLIISLLTQLLQYWYYNYFN